MEVPPIGREPGLMLTGEFSRKSGLSLKALRLYDAMGLLTPQHVDPESGYRYYAPSQLARARLASLLRRLEMPLDRIAAVLDLAGPDAARAVAAYWREVEADAREKAKLVRYLREHLEGRGESMFRIETRFQAEQKVVSIERRMYAPGLPAYIEEAMNALYGHLAAAGVQPTDPPFVIYHGSVTTDSEAPVEVCVPFTGSVEPAGEVRVRIEPEREEAFARITKAQVAFPGILDAYDAVHAWLEGNGKRMTASPREVYFADWGRIGEDDPGCDIAFPCTDA
ncbi:MAG TPA: MerR family transcriptional regulator [Deinococcales bacterium]|nr:MerR family transcriptional regulator [Deinococcales bacterium]